MLTATTSWFSTEAGRALTRRAVRQCAVTAEPADVARLAAQGPWDAVIDTCASVPGVVGQNARALAGQARAYLFVSSVSAFADWPARPLRDGMPLLEGAPGATEGDYGALKAGASSEPSARRFPAGRLSCTRG